MIHIALAICFLVLLPIIISIVDFTVLEWVNLLSSSACNVMSSKWTPADHQLASWFHSLRLYLFVILFSFGTIDHIARHALCIAEIRMFVSNEITPSSCHTKVLPCSNQLFTIYSCGVMSYQLGKTKINFWCAVSTRHCRVSKQLYSCYT